MNKYKLKVEGRNLLDKEQIYQLLTKEVGLEFVRQEEPMAKHTSFKIGGKADFYITAKEESVISTVLKIAKEQKVPVTILGNGTNVLVTDKGIRGIDADGFPHEWVVGLLYCWEKISMDYGSKSS